MNVYKDLDAMVHLINTWKLMDSSHWMWGHLGQRLACKTTAALYCFRMTNLAILQKFAPSNVHLKKHSTPSHNLTIYFPRRIVVVTPDRDVCQSGAGHVWDQVWQRRFGHEHIRASGYPGRKMLRLRLRCWDVEVWKSKQGFMGV